jgi:hypothetical protein
MWKWLLRSWPTCWTSSLWARKAARAVRGKLNPRLARRPLTTAEAHWWCGSNRPRALVPALALATHRYPQLLPCSAESRNSRRLPSQSTVNWLPLG